MSEYVGTFKFKAAVLFAIISFLIVIIAGLLRDVRFVTIAWRSLLAFLVTGGISYLIIFILEAKKIINFDLTEDEIKAEMAKSQEESEEQAQGGEQTGKSAENNSSGKEEGGGFKPLNADNLQRIAS